MKVYSAVMLDEEEVADHNCPTVLLAATAGILNSKVRDHIRAHNEWMERLSVDVTDIYAMSIEEINEKLCSSDAALFIHTAEEEV